MTFVDSSREMCELVKSNLELCRIERSVSEVIRSDADDYLRRFIAKQPDSGKPFDIAFFDPPYASDYARVLDIFGAHSSSLLNEDGLLIVEHHHKNELPAETGSIIRSRRLKQGDSALSFYELS